MPAVPAKPGAIDGLSTELADGERYAWEFSATIVAQRGARLIAQKTVRRKNKVKKRLPRLSKKCNR